MKLSFTIPALFLFSILLSSEAVAEGARSIFDSFETQKVEALEAYLEANPEAEDAAMAESMLVGSYLQLKEFEKAAPLLRKNYDSFPKGPGANLEELISGVIQPLFHVYSTLGDRASGREFHETVKNDLGSHPQARQILPIFDVMMSRLEMPTVGETLDIQFVSTAGEEIDLSAMTDQVVLVDFWATWCGPCVAKMPSLISTYEKYKEKGFEIVGICLDNNPAAFEQFTTQNGIDWPQHFDGTGFSNSFAQKYKVSGIPATFLIGKDGKIVATNLQGDSLDELVSSLLN